MADCSVWLDLLKSTTSSLVWTSVQIQVDVRTPFRQMLKLLPVGWLLFNKSNNGRVISKFDNGVRWVDEGAALSEKGVGDGAEDQYTGWEWKMCDLPSWQFGVCCWGSPVSNHTVNCLGQDCLISGPICGGYWIKAKQCSHTCVVAVLTESFVADVGPGQQVWQI